MCPARVAATSARLSVASEHQLQNIHRLADALQVPARDLL